jgi:hypothetical protein
MTVTVSWGTGSSARTWSCNRPETAALTIKRALGIAEPYLALVAAAAGAGAAEVLLVVAAVAAAKHLLSGTFPGDPKPIPASPQAVPGNGPR